MDLDIGQEETFLEPPAGRNKTSLRLKYEAETRVFRSRFGGLESVRKSLGLSRRQICQILLVDPSAWTRWCRDEDRVPPHIYRMLDWYLTLENRTELHPQISRVYLGSLHRDSTGVAAELADEVNLLRQQLKSTQRLMRRLSEAFVVGLILIAIAGVIW